MIARFIVFLILYVSLCGIVEAQTANLDLIPRPNKLQAIEEGFLNLDMPLPVSYSEDFKELTPLIAEIPGVEVHTYEVAKRGRKSQLRIRLLKAIDSDHIPKGAYRILIDDRGVFLKAHDLEIMRTAIFTLHQLRLLQGDNNAFPYLEIEDKPRFVYRGLHLDVSRHFMPFEFLLKYIDLMAIYKFNHFHWHLTDGAGWRLEIKQYPELTEKTAYRSHTDFMDWQAYGKRYVSRENPNAYGGFYTQDQARELVAYAATKGITIVPEIEMPGHAEEVLAVYPELSCTGTPYTQQEFCIGNVDTYTFIQNVLDEVMDIFPSQYIHIGGDEADKTHWKTCSKCQAQKEKEHLHDEAELLGHFMQQISDYLQSNGRKMIGWDEISEGGLPQGATIMSWRGEESGIQAANAGHDVIMTPQSHLYFDFYQFDPRVEPTAFGGYTPLEKVYSYNPIPEKIAKDKTKHILGAQANVWTEYMPTHQQVEYMAFPRALALAEVNWTAQEQRSFDDFKRRLQSHYPLLQAFGVNYHRPAFDISYGVEFDPSKPSNKVTLRSEQWEPTIRYTTDGTDPTNESTLYSLPIDLSISTTVKAASFLDSARVSPVTTVVLDIHKAVGKTVAYNNEWHKAYPAQGVKTLTNGKKGSISYQDGEWQGFTSNIDVVIDLDRREEIQRVAAQFMQAPGPGIFIPGELTVFVSENGKSYREVGHVINHEGNHTSVLEIKNIEVVFEKPIMTKYVKIMATNDKNGFLFIDEIVID